MRRTDRSWLGLILTLVLVAGLMLLVRAQHHQQAADCTRAGGRLVKVDRWTYECRGGR